MILAHLCLKSIYFISYYNMQIYDGPSLWCSIANILIVLQHANKWDLLVVHPMHHKSSSNKDLPWKFSTLDLIEKIVSLNWEALSSSSLNRALVLATCFLAMATSFSLRDRSSIWDASSFLFASNSLSQVDFADSTARCWLMSSISFVISLIMPRSQLTSIWEDSTSLRIANSSLIFGLGQMYNWTGL